MTGPGRAALLCLALSAASPALGQSGPSFDCAAAARTVERLICADSRLATLDRRLADRYGAALEVARGLDAGAETATRTDTATLRATQRGWIKGRDECWKADDPTDCIEAAYLRREGQLVARWLLEPPVATAFWACDGSPANEVVTLFFDTDLPSVRFERGDTIDTGSVVRTASGARYEGSFGRWIWIKGDRATYREADPDGATFTCTLAREE